MQIWIVTSPFSADVLPNEVFQRGLQRVDADSQSRIQRFIRRQDAWRCLVGRLLSQALLREHKIPQGSAIFGRTITGKPFIETLNMPSQMGYNVTHDNDVVAMVSRLGVKPTVDKIGIDIMKRSLPKGESVRSFLHAIEDTLTQSELAMFTSELDTTTAVRYIFMLWTLKEAYTKAVGTGLGFDFRRIEYNITRNSVMVDGAPPLGWEFLSFVVQPKESNDIYQGAVASWVGEGRGKMECVPSVEDDPRFHFRELSHLIDTSNY